MGILDILPISSTERSLVETIPTYNKDKDFFNLTPNSSQDNNALGQYKDPAFVPPVHTIGGKDYWVKDGSTIVENLDDGTKIERGDFLGRTQLVARTVEGKVLPATPSGAESAMVLNGILKNIASKDGSTLSFEKYITSDATRPEMSVFKAKVGGDDVNISQLMIKTAASTFNPEDKRLYANGTRDISGSYSSVQIKNQELAKEGAGVHSYKTLIAINELTKEAADPGFAVFRTNKKCGQTNYNLKLPENRNRVKIGDVWLSIPPTHLSITQLRNSDMVDLIGAESKPVQTSTTNRIIIKYNLIFSGQHSIQNDLKRILLQFKYCPINIIQSYDLFNKLTGKQEKNDHDNMDLGWLYQAYGKDEKYCVPVTMDQATLYTIEGHPNSVGMSLQFSLFNFAPYFKKSQGERMQYYKFNEEFYKPTDKKDDIQYKDIVITERAPNAIFETTVDLEDSIHPYNFIIEHELETFGSRYFDDNIDSDFKFYKIDKSLTIKEAMYKYGRLDLTPEESATVVASSLVEAMATSISISISNNWAWQPLLGFSQPIAQFIGPGEINVCINVKSNNQDAINKILKVYNHLANQNVDAYYDDRYMIHATLLATIGIHIASLQSVAVNTIPGKPGWNDINFLFHKTSYETDLLENEVPVIHDEYWGLQRILKLTELTEFKDIAQKISKVQTGLMAGSCIAEINGNSEGGCDLSQLGLTFKSELEHTLQYIKKFYPEIYKNMQLIRTGITPRGINELDYEVFQAQLDLYKSNKKIARKITDDSLEAKILRERLGYDQALTARKERIAESVSKITVGNQIMAGVGYSVAISLKTTSSKEAQLIQDILTRNISIKGLDASKNREETQSLYQFNVVKQPAGTEIHYLVTINPNQATKNIQQAWLNHKADVTKVISDADKERLFGVQNKVNICVKPYAAHRYLGQLADHLISESLLLSKSIGYWFACDKISDQASYFKNIKEAIKDSICPILDTVAFQTGYIKDTFGSSFQNKIDPSDPSSRAIALLYPDLKQDLKSYDRSTQSMDAEQKSLFKQTGEKDYSFDKFSDMLLYPQYFGTGNALNEKLTQYHANQVNQKFYNIGTDVQKTLSDVYDKNTKLQGVIDKSKNVLIRTSQNDMANISNGVITEKMYDATLGSKPGVYAPVVNHRSILIAQQRFHAMNKNPEGVADYANGLGSGASYEARRMEFLKADADAVPLAIDKGKAVFGNYAASTTAASNAIVRHPDTYVPSVAKNKMQNSEDDLIKANSLSMAPTCGLQHVFPTYKLYIIHDNISEVKFKALDDYWDYRLVQDLMVIRDKNNPSHILKARLVVDKRYTTVNPEIMQKLGNSRSLIETRDTKTRATLNTKDMYKFARDKAPLRQGMRICLKLGYSTDPRALETVFIGTITNLSLSQDHGMADLEARGDGRELCLPASIKDEKLEGSNFADLISKMLRTNPNVLHFGKVYGGYLERFTRDHQILSTFISQNVLNLSNLYVPALWMMGGGVAGGAFKVGSKMFGQVAAHKLTQFGVGAGLVAGGVFGPSGMSYFPGIFDVIGEGKVADKTLYAIQRQEIPTKVAIRLKDAWSSFCGDTFNAEKAGYQVSKILHQVYEWGNNPVDDNIFAVDIYTGGTSRNVNLKINNQKTIWDILVNIKRFYPGWALDVRPYGSRSTLFLGAKTFHYWRTDDPLMAMAPSLIDFNKVSYKSGDTLNDELGRGILALGTDVDKRKNTPMDSENVAPLVPFTKTHTATSYDNIIYNGIKCTPDRGWNSVVVSKGANEEPEEFVANANLYHGALRRRMEIVDWVDNPRLMRHYALGLLKEGVERMYGGTLILKGNALIEPYDRIVLIDEVNRMYGTVEVETVIHKFDNHTGFTTHIVPNMVCQINDSSYITGSDLTRKMLIKELGAVTLEGSIFFALSVATVAIPGGPAAMIGAAFALEVARSAWGLYTAQKDVREDIKNGTLLENEKESNLKTQTNVMDMMSTSLKGTVDEAAVISGIGIGYIRNFLKNPNGRTVKEFLGERNITWLKASGAGVAARTAAAKSAFDAARSIPGGAFRGFLDAAKAVTKKAGSSSAAAVAVDGAEAVGKKGIISSLGKFAGPAAYLFMGMAVVSIPKLMETYILSSATKHNMIMAQPLWWKDALMMQGLEGYKNNDVWMHMKDIIINAFEVLPEAWSDVKNYDSYEATEAIMKGSNLFTSVAAKNAFAGTWGASANAEFIDSKIWTEEEKGAKINLLSARILEFRKGQTKRNKNGDIIARSLPSDIAIWVFDAAKENNIEFSLLASVCEHESGGWDEYAINTNTPTSIDFGIAQINTKAHPDFYAKYPLEQQKIKPRTKEAIYYAANYLSSFGSKIDKRLSVQQKSDLYYIGYNAGTPLSRSADAKAHVAVFKRTYNKIAPLLG